MDFSYKETIKTYFIVSPKQGLSLNGPFLRLNDIHFEVEIINSHDTLLYLYKNNSVLLRLLIYLLLVLFFAGCENDYKASYTFTADSAMVRGFIKKGDSLYATKAGYTTFSNSMQLYDSAMQIAVNLHDTALIAMSVFAKGRAYDAINSDPQKTIDYFKEAAELYAVLPGKYNSALYIKHLVAHSYDKVNDSANCVKILKQLYNEIQGKTDSIKKEMRFIAEMALISTEVKNYELAAAILAGLTHREWIKNDPEEYDYLDHYYLTKARIEVFMKKNFHSPYLDSIEWVFIKSSNSSDSMYYSSQLWELYKNAGNHEKANSYLGINNAIFNRFKTPQSLRETEERLTKMETASIEKQRKMEQEQGLLRKKYIYVLSTLLAIITLLTIFLVNRNRTITRKRNEAVVTSNELMEKNLQNELLNKEIHHRIKNNLQMILSLVYMQEKKTETNETKVHLQNIRLRIENIAAMHQQLLEQDDNAVDLKKHITQLVNSIASLIGHGHSVFTHLAIDEVNLTAKQTFPLGLLLNEWITNSIKYAKPINETLAVYITIKKRNKDIVINYKDSGKPEIKQPVKSGLGMSIINLLTAQLNGELHRDDSNYFDYSLTIPADGE